MRKAVLIVLIAVLAAGGVWFLYARAHQEPTIEGPAISVRFTDDEFGNAVIIRTPEGKVAVVDPARRRTSALIGLLRDEHVRQLTVVVSAPSSDTAGAIAKLQRSVKVERVIRTQQGRTPQQWKSMLVRAKCRPAAETLVEPGGSAQLSPTVRLDVLCPGKGAAKSEGSSVIRLNYRGKGVLYITELHAEGEAALISSGVNLQSSVIAVGKRGGRDNPSLELLSKVRPEFCVLCSNRPSASIISRLRQENSGATLFRTDKDGIIEIVTDGHSVQSVTGGGP